MEILFTDNQKKDLQSTFQFERSRIMSAQFAIAFVKYSGLSKLVPFIEDSITHGGVVEFIVGLDFRTTDPRSLSELHRLSRMGGLKYFCFSDPGIDNSPVFHPKLYIMKYTDGVNRVVIGSSNLSAGGLADNVEVNVVFENMDSGHFDEVQAIYLGIRRRETLFVPDEEYIEAYRDVFKRVQKETSNALTKQRVTADIEHLRKREERLPGTVPTQIDLIVEAIKNCGKDERGYVRLRDMQRYIRMRAQALNIPWDYSTLENSIRGRLNTHSQGRGGMELFERQTGRGLYKLTGKGLEYKSRRVVT